MIKDSAYWIRKLGLEPHPEGGYYRQTYRADLVLEGLPHQFSGSRAASTAIYFCSRARIFPPFIDCSPMNFGTSTLERRSGYMLSRRMAAIRRFDSEAIRKLAG